MLPFISDYPDYSQNHYPPEEYEDNKVKFEKDEDDRGKFHPSSKVEHEENGRNASSAVADMAYGEEENY